MKRLLLVLLLLPAACGQPADKMENAAVQRGVDRAVADVEAAEAATGEPAAPDMPTRG